MCTDECTGKIRSKRWPLKLAASQLVSSAAATGLRWCQNIPGSCHELKMQFCLRTSSIAFNTGFKILALRISFFSYVSALTSHDLYINNRCLRLSSTILSKHFWQKESAAENPSSEKNNITLSHQCGNVWIKTKNCMWGNYMCGLKLLRMDSPLRLFGKLTEKNIPRTKTNALEWGLTQNRAPHHKS